MISLKKKKSVKNGVKKVKKVSKENKNPSPIKSGKKGKVNGDLKHNLRRRQRINYRQDIDLTLYPNLDIEFDYIKKKKRRKKFRYQKISVKR